MICLQRASTLCSQRNGCCWDFPPVEAHVPSCGDVARGWFEFTPAVNDSLCGVWVLSTQAMTKNMTKNHSLCNQREWPPWVCLSHQGARLRGGRTALVTRPGAVLKVARRGVCTESSTGDSPAGGVPFGYSMWRDSPWKRRVLPCGRPSQSHRQLSSSPAATRSKYGRVCREFRSINPDESKLPRHFSLWLALPPPA